MPTIRRPRLLKADVLRAMKPRTLDRLLSPYTDYFRSRDVDLGGLCGPGFDFTRLDAVLAKATEQTPPALIEHLDMLDLIADRQSFLNFESEYHEVLALLIEKDDTPADIAVKILIERPEIAYREYDRQALRAQRSLVSFRVKAGMPFLGTDTKRIERFRRIVIPWFAENARSGVCLFHHLDESDGHAFVIRHGDLLKRVGVFLDDEGKQESWIYRPEQVDIAHFHPATGEWQISGLGMKLQELYRIAFGDAFHGSPNALTRSRRYDLSQLFEGPESLGCDPTGIVQHAELKRVSMVLPDGQHHCIAKGNVFDGLRLLQPRALNSANLVEATFSLKLANRRRRVQVRICPDRDTIIGNTADPAIDTWLLERGFANDESRVLASA